MADTMEQRDKLSLGYTTGEVLHTSYWHYDFEVVGYTNAGEVVVKNLSTGQVWSHLTAKDRFAVTPGECPRQKHGYDCVAEAWRRWHQ